MKAIPTFYDGIEYRSRLEARWAAFFDQLGWQYTYEPFDGDYYIPDFIIHGDGPLVVEIKRAVTPGDYQAAATKVARGISDTWQRGAVIFGVSPCHGPGYMRASRWAPTFHTADWYLCPVCHAVTIGTVITRHVGFRPCGHRHPSFHGPRDYQVADSEVIQWFWASAINRVKWRSRDA
jgi:hypothetical protein